MEELHLKNICMNVKANCPGEGDQVRERIEG
jgi:hypothetical protein